MLVSFAVMLLGLGWWLEAGMPSAAGSLVASIPVAQILDELLAGNPLAMLDLGVLVLIATPVITIVAILASYVLDRNARFAAVAALVLAILLLSVALSLKWIKLF